MALSSFHSARLTIRAVLAAALLVFGHVLLTTISGAPLPASDLHPLLPPALKSLSALTFLTLLWVCFSALEGADHAPHPRPVRSVSRPGSIERDDNGREGWVFLRTEVEAVLGMGFVVAWALFYREALVVMHVFSPSVAIELVTIRIAYTFAMLALLALQLQLVGSLVLHAAEGALDGVPPEELCGGRTGWWTERIRLGDEEAEKS